MKIRHLTNLMKLYICYLCVQIGLNFCKCLIFTSLPSLWCVQSRLGCSFKSVTFACAHDKKGLRS